MGSNIGGGNGSGSTGTGNSGSGGNGSGSGGGSTGSGSSAGAASTAYVYVSDKAPGGSANQVEAWSAASNGALTPLGGSPFAANVTSMAAGSGHLFGVNANGVDVESYSIASDGALTHETTAHAAQTGNCNSLGNLFMDRSGASLYALNYRGSGCSNNTYESFAVNSSTGALNDLGNSTANNWLAKPASFMPDDTHAYAVSCLSDMYWGMWGFSRSNTGLLTQLSIKAAPPTPPAGYFYCPSATAADAAGNIVIALQPVDQQSFNPNKPAQLAVYAVQANGDLATSNTAAAMPSVVVGNATDMKISPGGDLLAVAGSNGLQVFHFSSVGTITAYTGPLASDEIDQMFWDSQGHLYALSQPAGKLYVFTVTSSGYAQATGSPYAVGGAQGLAVEAQ